MTVPVPNHFIAEVINAMHPNLKNTFYAQLVEKQEEGNEKLFEDFINQLVWESFEYKLASDVKAQYKDRRNRSKTNWYNAIKKEKEGKTKTKKTIMIEYDSYKMLIDLIGVESFKEQFKVDSIDDLINASLQKVSEWLKNNNSYLIDYPYIKSLTKGRLETAIKTDLVIGIADILIKNYNQKIENVITPQVNIFEEPLFSSDKTLLKLKKDIVDNKVIVYNDYIVDEDYIIRTIINPNENHNDVIYQRNYALDAKDCKIVNFVFSCRDHALFLNEKTVVVDIGQLVRYIYGNNASKNYKSIEKRLGKLSSYQLKAIRLKDREAENTQYYINIFSDVIIKIDENSKKRKAIIRFGDVIHQQYINSHTIKIYSSQIRSFLNPLSEILIFPLQKQRLLSYKNSKNNQDNTNYYLKTLTYSSFFRYKARFPEGNKKEKNIKLIAQSLEEFKNNQVVVGDYKRVGDAFEIKFLPVTEYEILDGIVELKNETSWFFDSP